MGRKATVVVLARILARVCMSPFFRLRPQGVESLPAKGPFVLLPKHQRWEDVPLLGLAAPCPLHYVAKQELFDHPLSRLLITALGGIPLNRRRPLQSRHAIRGLKKLLEEGGRVVIFPEGTYCRGRMGSGQGGLLRLLRSRMRLAYVPVGIRYGAEKGRETVEIRFGEAIRDDASSASEEFLDGIMTEIARLSGFLYPPSKSPHKTSITLQGERKGEGALPDCRQTQHKIECKEEGNSCHASTKSSSVSTATGRRSSPFRKNSPR